MLIENKEWKVLGEFFLSPSARLQHRELSRKTRLGEPTVGRILKSLLKDGIITRKKGSIYPYYEANRESRAFKRLKVMHTLLSLDPLAERIAQSARPNCIILYGSASRGEDHEKSDVDIFVQSREQKTETKEQERKLKRPIHLLFEPKLSALSTHIKNNLANGIVLHGYYEVLG